MASAPTPWSARDLRRRCTVLREQVTTAEIASPDEVARYWPGGSDNSESGRGAWIYCYAQFVRLCGRMEQEAADSDEAQAARRDGLVDRAQPVTLASGDVVMVHPLPAYSLQYLTSLDRMTTRNAELAAQWALADTDASERVLAIEPIVRAEAVRQWAWVLTAGAGAMPFDPQGAYVAPPAWTKTLTPEDLVALYTAHAQVNARRSALVASLFPPSAESPSRLPLEGFIGAYAHERGQDAAHYMKHLPVGRLFAQAVSAAEQHEEAMARAKKPAGDGLGALLGAA